MQRPARRKSELSRSSGVTIVELMIALLVLSVGIIGIAQLYAVATVTGALSVNTSTGLVDAQRCIEAMRGIAHSSSSGIKDPRLVSATFDSSRGNSPTYLTVTGYDSERFRENIWVYSNTGRVDGNGVDPPGSTTHGSPYAVSSVLPPGYTTAPLAPTASSLTVVVRLEPIVKDRRFIQSVTLATVISHEY
jgi:hypothetical protein